VPGYKGIPAKDQFEQRLREQWYAAKGFTKEVVGQKLSDYIWRRAEMQVAQDRARHPKKKRNLPVPEGVVNSGGRYLP